MILAILKMKNPKLRQLNTNYGPDSGNTNVNKTWWLPQEAVRQSRVEPFLTV